MSTAVAPMVASRRRYAAFCQWGGVIAFISLHLAGSAFAASPSNSVAASGLPPLVYEQLKEQSAPMRLIYLESASENENLRTANCTFVSGNRFYQRTEYTLRARAGSAGRRPQVHEVAFDGTIFYSGDRDRPRGGAPAIYSKFLVSDTGDPDRDIVGLTGLSTYFDAAGVFVPSSIADLDGFTGLESLVLHYLKESERTIVTSDGKYLRVSVRIKDPGLEGARKQDPGDYRKFLESVRASKSTIEEKISVLKHLKRVVPKRRIDFLLDPDMGWAVAERFDFTDSGQMIRHIQSEEWRSFAGGIWLPRRCIDWSYVHIVPQRGESLQSTVITLKAAELPTDRSFPFTLDYKWPGTIIVDKTTAEARTNAGYQVRYFVEADAKTLKRVGEAVRDQRDRPKYLFWVMANAALVATAIFVWLMRKRRFGDRP